MRYLIIVCLLLFVCAEPAFALKEVEYKSYITFDGKVFDDKAKALQYEKIMSKIEILMKVFQDKIGNLKKQKLEDQKRGICYSGYDPYKMEIYDDYRDLLYECFKKFDEQGYEVEIKINKKGE